MNKSLVLLTGLVLTGTASQTASARTIEERVAFIESQLKSYDKILSIVSKETDDLDDRVTAIEKAQITR